MGASGPQFALFGGGFFGGAALWCRGISALIGRGRRFVRPALFRWISTLCGLALGYFGLRVPWLAAWELFGRPAPLSLRRLRA